MQKALEFLGHGEGSFPVAEQVSKEVLSLPMYPELDAADIQYAADTILACFKE